MNKKLYLEMVLCIVLGILVGICLAFRYSVNPYLAATVCGLAGAFCFRPGEVISILWSVTRASCGLLIDYGKAIGVMTLIAMTLGLSLVFHYFLAVFIENHIPGAYSSVWNTVFVLYLVGATFGLIFWAIFFSDRKNEPVSWSMPISSRIYDFQIKHGLNKFPVQTRCVVSVLQVVFCLPVSLFLFFWLLLVSVLDLVLTMAMLLFFTPRLAIAIGGFTGTLAGCCFCVELWTALLLGWSIGVPVGLGFHWLRWHLSSAEDRQAWSTATA